MAKSRRKTTKPHVYNRFRPEPFVMEVDGKRTLIDTGKYTMPRFYRDRTKQTPEDKLPNPSSVRYQGTRSPCCRRSIARVYRPGMEDPVKARRTIEALKPQWRKEENRKREDQNDKNA